MNMLRDIKEFLGDKNIEVETSYGKFTLCKANEIEEFQPKIYCFDLDYEHEFMIPKGNDPNEELGIYLGKAINLVKFSENYSHLGLLLYLPDLNLVGTWDKSQYQLNVFTGLSWDEISNNLPAYLGSLWGDRNFDNVLEIFEPWKHWEFIPN